MEQQLISTLSTKERRVYDTYTKEQIYEAYVMECKKTEKLSVQLSLKDKHLAKIRYEVNR